MAGITATASDSETSSKTRTILQGRLIGVFLLIFLRNRWSAR